MNYSKKSRETQSKEMHSKKKKVKKKANIVAFRATIITITLIIFAITGAGLGVVLGIINTAPDISQVSIKPTDDYMSFVYDAAGNEMDRLSSGENRIHANLSQMPDNLQKAFIATEDERFYEHKGIDIKGIFRAIVANLKSGRSSQGASTITQQLVKLNVLKDTEKTYTRKIQEQYLALQFDKLYTKDLILETYLNTVALGHGEYGVQAAANRYFNKDVSDLTLSESVVISCITQNPTQFSPISKPENNRKKFETVLRKMYEQGYITATEQQEALDDDPYARIAKVHQKFISQASHSYFVDQVVEDLIKDLQISQGISSAQATNLIYGGGLHIYTTFDPNAQASVDKHMNNPDLFPSSSSELKVSYSVSVKKADGTDKHYGGDGIVKNEEATEKFKSAKEEEWGITSEDKVLKRTLFRIPQPQAAISIMDHSNGHVIAISGGRGDKLGDRTFNRATQAKRQPGSVFKVLAAYAPGIDTGLMSPGTIIVDEPFTWDIPGGKPYSPKNWYSGFRGAQTVRVAIRDSMNVSAVKALQTVGIDTAYDYLLRFGFTTLTPQDKVPSLSLGGIDGVTPLELTAAFGAIANDGVYIKPILYTKVLDQDNNLVLDNEPETHMVLKESTAYMLTDMMQDVVDGSGSATGKRIRNTFKGMPIAGKTGTTSKKLDLLFSGYTPYYVATIWMGHDQPKPLNFGSSYTLDLWAAIMKDLHEGLPVKDFPLPPGLTQATICGISGKLATDLCRLDPNGSAVTTDFFLKEDLPTEFCDLHVEENICTVSGKIANQYCPPELVKRGAFVRHTHGDSSGLDVCDIHNENTAIEIPIEDLNPDDDWIDNPWGPDNPNLEGTDPIVPEPEQPKPEKPQPEKPKPEKPKPEEPTPPDSIDDFFIPQS
ncbi:MAG TPA: PBP1A family penicillin-binding protein [Epulopiscium sp.]|nr:PBP1A family penicillin-binding protein [Candidatus Epulonipiscium sp.]